MEAATSLVTVFVAPSTKEVAMSKLRQRMIQDLEFARRAESTKRQYINSIRNLSEYYDRCPSKLGPDEIRAWVQLLRNGGIKEDRLRQLLLTKLTLHENPKLRS